MTAEFLQIVTGLPPLAYIVATLAIVFGMGAVAVNELQR